MRGRSLGPPPPSFWGRLPRPSPLKTHRETASTPAVLATTGRDGHAGTWGRPDGSAPPRVRHSARARGGGGASRPPTPAERRAVLRAPRLMGAELSQATAPACDRSQVPTAPGPLRTTEHPSNRGTAVAPERQYLLSEVLATFGTQAFHDNWVATALHAHQDRPRSEAESPVGGLGPLLCLATRDGAPEGVKAPPLPAALPKPQARCASPAARGRRAARQTIGSKTRCPRGEGTWGEREIPQIALDVSLQPCVLAPPASSVCAKTELCQHRTT